MALVASVAEARDNTDRLFKSRNSDLYYGHLHMEYYYFYQQCEDYFEVTESLDQKHISFAIGILKDRILNWWQQHKTRMQCNWPAPMTWEEFKAFLRKNLGESNTYVGYIWSKLKEDAQY